MKEKKCIDCGKDEVVERRRCGECAKKFNRKRLKDYYNKVGRYNYGKGVCSICGKEMTMWKREQLSHLSCRYKNLSDYNNQAPRDKRGNALAHGLVLEMGIDIPKNYVVHHFDEDPFNNEPSNLYLMPRSAHSSLHRKLQIQRSLWLKSHSSNDENCWKTIRDHITKAWLETTSANVIKICDIWQSAAEAPKSE
jgi:hypothetical protein